jgi:hypothetical protein
MRTSSCQDSWQLPGRRAGSGTDCQARWPTSAAGQCIDGIGAPVARLKSVAGLARRGSAATEGISPTLPGRDLFPVDSGPAAMDRYILRAIEGHRYKMSTNDIHPRLVDGTACLVTLRKREH